jgi:hypothetical protein
MALILFAILGAEIGASTLYWVLFWIYLIAKVIIAICDSIKNG